MWLYSSFFNRNKHGPLSKHLQLSKTREEIRFACDIEKINEKGKLQKRKLVITNKALYNVTESLLGKYITKRKIFLIHIEPIFVCLSTGEFVLHVANEYDYKFKSKDCSSTIRALKQAYEAYAKEKKISRATILMVEMQSNELNSVMVRKNYTLDERRGIEAHIHLLVSRPDARVVRLPLSGSGGLSINGVRIARVVPGGIADKAGLKVGNIFKTIEGKSVPLNASGTDIRKLLRDGRRWATKNDSEYLTLQVYTTVWGGIGQVRPIVSTASTETKSGANSGAVSKKGTPSSTPTASQDTLPVVGSPTPKKSHRAKKKLRKKKLATRSTAGSGKKENDSIFDPFGIVSNDDEGTTKTTNPSGSDTKASNEQDDGFDPFLQIAKARSQPNKDETEQKKHMPSSSNNILTSPVIEDKFEEEEDFDPFTDAVTNEKKANERVRFKEEKENGPKESTASPKKEEKSDEFSPFDAGNLKDDDKEAIVTRPMSKSLAALADWNPFPSQAAVSFSPPSPAAKQVRTLTTISETPTMNQNKMKENQKSETQKTSSNPFDSSTFQNPVSSSSAKGSNPFEILEKAHG